MKKTKKHILHRPLNPVIAAVFFLVSIFLLGMSVYAVFTGTDLFSFAASQGTLLKSWKFDTNSEGWNLVGMSEKGGAGNGALRGTLITTNGGSAFFVNTPIAIPKEVRSEYFELMIGGNKLENSEDNPVIFTVIVRYVKNGKSYETYPQKVTADGIARKKRFSAGRIRPNGIVGPGGLAGTSSAPVISSVTVVFQSQKQISVFLDQIDIYGRKSIMRKGSGSSGTSSSYSGGSGGSSTPCSSRNGVNYDQHGKPLPAGHRDTTCSNSSGGSTGGSSGGAGVPCSSHNGINYDAHGNALPVGHRDTAGC